MAESSLLDGAGMWKAFRLLQSRLAGGFRASLRNSIRVSFRKATYRRYCRLRIRALQGLRLIAQREMLGVSSATTRFSWVSAARLAFLHVFFC
jgi:hypothetical protein